MGPDLERELDLARRLGNVAAAAALPFFDGSYWREIKDDGSPVTEADFAVERAVLEVLARERPGDEILSEEGGRSASTGGSRRWLIDPIDGTEHFVAARPNWGTHIALEVDGDIVVGVITRPVEKRSRWAAAGHGAWRSTGHQLRVSSVAEILPARVGGYVRPESAWKADVARRARWVDSPSPILDLIDGSLDAVLSEGGFEWDHAPAVVLVREAGGVFTDPQGGTRIDLRGGLYSNGQLDTQLERSRPT
jgi:histidinol-phosphatase